MTSIRETLPRMAAILQDYSYTSPKDYEELEDLLQKLENSEEQRKFLARELEHALTNKDTEAEQYTKAIRQEVQMNVDGCELDLTPGQIDEVTIRFVDCDWITQQMNERIMELIADVQKETDNDSSSS